MDKAKLVRCYVRYAAFSIGIFTLIFTNSAHPDSFFASITATKLAKLNSINKDLIHNSAKANRLSSKAELLRTNNGQCLYIRSLRFQQTPSKVIKTSEAGDKALDSSAIGFFKVFQLSCSKRSPDDQTSDGKLTLYKEGKRYKLDGYLKKKTGINRITLNLSDNKSRGYLSYQPAQKNTLMPAAISQSYLHEMTTDSRIRFSNYNPQPKIRNRKLTASLNAGKTLYKIDLALDVDYATTKSLGSVNAALARVMLVTDMMRELYLSQLNIQVNVTFIHIWEIQDPYTAGRETLVTTSLLNFADSWRSNYSGIDYDIANLFRGVPPASSVGTDQRGLPFDVQYAPVGSAFHEAICDRDLAFSASILMLDYLYGALDGFQWPENMIHGTVAGSYDVFIYNSVSTLAHEIAHVLGAEHDDYSEDLVMSPFNAGLKFSEESISRIQSNMMLPCISQISDATINKPNAPFFIDNKERLIVMTELSNFYDSHDIPIVYDADGHAQKDFSYTFISDDPLVDHLSIVKDQYNDKLKIQISTFDDNFVDTCSGANFREIKFLLKATDPTGLSDTIPYTIRVQAHKRSVLLQSDKVIIFQKQIYGKRAAVLDYTIDTINPDCEPISIIKQDFMPVYGISNDDLYKYVVSETRTSHSLTLHIEIPAKVRVQLKGEYIFTDYGFQKVSRIILLNPSEYSEQSDVTYSESDNYRDRLLKLDKTLANFLNARQRKAADKLLLKARKQIKLLLGYPTGNKAKLKKIQYCLNMHSKLRQNVIKSRKIINNIAGQQPVVSDRVQLEKLSIGND